MVFIQVLFESESTSATENQFRSYFELCNETSRQVHKTSVNIEYCLHLYTESAGDAVQVFAIEWCHTGYVCWRNNASYVKMIREVDYALQ